MADSPETLQKFTRVYKPQDIICKQGESGDCMYIIQAGKVEVFLTTSTGEKSLAFYGPGDFFGEMSMIDKAPRSANIRAVEETRLISLDAQTFDAHIQTNPAIVRKILINMSNRLRDANKQIENLLIKDVNRRIANHILLECHQHGTKTPVGIKIDHPFGANELARDVGLQDDAQKVQGVLQKLQQSKIIEIQGGQIVILSVESLEKFIQYLAMKEEFGF